MPRSKLPTVMAQIQAIAARHGLVVANVFHAGDGNLHPMICYDERVPGEFARALEANEEILHACIDARRDRDRGARRRASTRPRSWRSSSTRTTSR